MPNKTKIEWTDYSSNGISARRKGISYAHLKAGWFCDKPDAKGGCLNCYAESINLRWGNGLRFDKTNKDLVGFTIRKNEQTDLLKLNAKHPGSKVFVGDMFDLFQPSIPADMLHELFDTYDQCSNLKLQFLTKYTARMSHFFIERYNDTQLPEHFWVGMSAATQSWFDKNINHLLNIKAAVRWLSLEPLLEPVNIKPYFFRCTCGQPNIADCECKGLALHWCVLGGESGTKPRPMDVEWVRSVRNECGAAAVPFFFKQGSQANWPNFKDFDNFPAEFQIREFPNIQ